jgi:hypothetical protein
MDRNNFNSTSSHPEATQRRHKWPKKQICTNSAYFGEERNAVDFTLLGTFHLLGK